VADCISDWKLLSELIMLEVDIDIIEEAEDIMEFMLLIYVMSVLMFVITEPPLLMLVWTIWLLISWLCVMKPIDVMVHMLIEEMLIAIIELELLMKIM